MLRATLRFLTTKVNGTYRPGPNRSVPELRSAVPRGTPSRAPAAEILARDQERSSLFDPLRARSLNGATGTEGGSGQDQGSSVSFGDHAALNELIEKHTLFTWGTTDGNLPASIMMARADGVYFWDVSGKKYIDFNSMAMCNHYGHNNREISDAVVEQIETAAYGYPCAVTTPIKATLSALMADILPGDIDAFFYPGGGAESNETALRMAKAYTGRNKILARYRSYHGGTTGTMAVTGDFRRWATEPGMAGVIHVMDPHPYNFDWGVTDGDEEELTARSLAYLQEVISYEGGHNIAAFFTESVSGTNGILKPPKGYLEGVRAICDEHGILMVADEVMTGFGRTGKMFGFEHSDPCVIPDIVTMAKGINGAFLPLGAVGVRRHVADHFAKNPLPTGSTYNSHAVTLASAHAAIRFNLKHDIVGKAAAMQSVMEDCMNRIAENHVCVKQARAHGMFGVIELQGDASTGEWLHGYNGGVHPKAAEFKTALRENGLYTLMRWDQIYCNPPLVATEEEVREGFDIIDKCLHIIDPVVKNA